MACRSEVRRRRAKDGAADRDRSRWLTRRVSRVTEHGRDTIDRNEVREMVVDQTGASWNQIAEWLRRLNGLWLAA